MDTAVSLVQAYLQVNGYFTVVEYPVLEVVRRGSTQAVTDLDVLAFRFPGAGPRVEATSRSRATGIAATGVDPALGCPGDRPDMIVGEVKEGKARFNAATRDPRVLEVALARFGCCAPENASQLAQGLLERGHARSHSGHAVRMVAFGMGPTDAHAARWHVVPMQHVVRFLQDHVRQHWDVLRHAQLKQSAMGFLAMLEKSTSNTSPRGGSAE